jgi:hypothetical protein
MVGLLVWGGGGFLLHAITKLVYVTDLTEVIGISIDFLGAIFALESLDIRADFGSQREEWQLFAVLQTKAQKYGSHLEEQDLLKDV